MAIGARAQPQGAIRAAATNPYGKRLLTAATPVASFGGTARRASNIAASPLGLYTTGGSGSYVQSVRQAQPLAGRQLGAVADNANISFVIVATGLGANSWIYDGQENGSSFYLKTDGSGNLVYSNDSRVMVTAALPSTHKVILVSGGGYNGALPKVWVDGVLVYTGTTDTTGHWNQTPTFRAFFGSSSFPTANMFNGKGYFVAVLRGLLTDADVLPLTANPYQMVDDPAQTQMRAIVSTATSTDVNCTAASATGAGPGATVTLPTNVAANPGSASGAGPVAVVALTTLVSASAGTSANAGLSSAVTLPTIVAASNGASAGTGLASIVTLPTTVPAGTAASGGAGQPATISTGLMIACATASAAATGRAASIMLPTVVACGTAGATGKAQAAVVGGAANIACSIAPSRSTGLPAAVTWPTGVACSTASAISAGRAASITAAHPVLLPNPHRTYMVRPRVRVYVGQKRVRTL